MKLKLTYGFMDWTDSFLDDVEHINPYANIKSETYTITGSRGDKYTVTNRNGNFSCNCPAGKFRGYCKHSTQVQKELSLVE